ncbi:hypothetical protein SAMN05192583_2428 [Sphingomonas gellani]|uniref:Uncharacterized protein n=1 Tax=Sphingomonas gellani TaxID=1166340 RepID=A0A1H8F5N1_9SPHN|nr:hypothetical protein SAMN05192583_2428 [Sphingomonas gellani]
MGRRGVQDVVIAMGLAVAAAAPASAQSNLQAIPDNFSLPPGNSAGDQIPAPAQVPLPRVRIAPTPSIAPTTPAPVIAEPTTKATPRKSQPAPQPAATETATPSRTATPTPKAEAPVSTPAEAEPVPVAAPQPAPVVEQPAPPRTAPAPRESVRPTEPIEPVPLGEGAGGSPAPQSSTGIEWWVGALAALVVLAATLVVARLLIRRRGQTAMAEATAAPHRASADPQPVARDVAPAVGPRPSQRRETMGDGLTIDFQPSRAGLNLLTATVTGEVLITNTGPAPVEKVRVEARLISAHADQDGEIRAIHEAEIGRPLTPAFALQPGETRRVNAIVALPQGAIKALKAGERPMFVPLVVVSAAYQQGSLTRRAGGAFAVGVERGDSAKLAPFWLDGTPRMHTQVAARTHGTPYRG